MNKQKNSIVIYRRWALACLFCIIVTVQNTWAQTKGVDSTTAVTYKSKEDSIRKTGLNSISEAIKNDTLVPYVVGKVGLYTRQIHQSESVVNKMSDYLDLYKKAGIDVIDNACNGIKNALDSQVFNSNMQSINTLMILFKENQDYTQQVYDNLNTYYDKLNSSYSDSKLMFKDPIWNVTDDISDDLLSQLKDLYNDGQDILSKQSSAVYRINVQRNKIALVLMRITDMLSELKYINNNLNYEIWEKEQPALLSARPKDYHTASYLHSVKDGIERAGMIIKIYLKKKWDVRIVSWLILMLLTIGSFLNYKKYKAKNTVENNDMLRLVKRGILLTSLFCFYNYVIFFYLNPPPSYLEAIDFFRTVFLTIIMWPLLKRKGREVWLCLFVIWLFFLLDDLFLSTSFLERWLLLLFSVGIIVLNRYLMRDQQDFLHLPFFNSKIVKTLCVISSAISVAGILCNLTGRVTLAKNFGLTAIQMVNSGIALAIFGKIILEYIYLNAEVRENSRLSAFLNYKEQAKKYRVGIIVFMCAAWLITVLRSLSYYDEVLSALGYVLSMPIGVGSFSFSLSAIFIFILVIWVAAFISKFISYLLGGDSAAEHKKISSMALLIRLAIWIVGFMIAVAAAGIPLEKVTLIIGGLGVGIGFGLQNIVNNLVSGVILAFERPFHIGDQIEIGSKTGTVREIGVRSSKLRIGNGADIIVPNGDLLSQQLTNWTISDRSKRTVFPLRVSYGADLNKALEILYAAIDENENITKYPKPTVTVSEFTQLAIVITIGFWVPELNNEASVKSELMTSCYIALQQANIPMPNLGNNPTLDNGDAV